MVDKFFRYCVRYKTMIIGIALIIAVLFPFLFPSQYTIRIAILSLMNIMLAVSLNLLTGFMGQMSFGHAAFYGIGAYTAAILATRFQMNSVATFALAAAVAGAFGFLLGLPVLKLRGYYLTIVTMGFCEIVRIVELNWMSLTNGPMGMMNIPKPSIGDLKIANQYGFYYLILFLVILTTVIVKRIVDSRVGTAILAIRDDDLAAEAMGVNIVKYKVITFTISAVFAGLAGAFYAQYISFIDPSSFTTNQSLEMTVMVIFGGLGSVVGSFVGAITLTVLPELLRGLAQYRMLIYGFVMVIMMMIKPVGLFGNTNFKYISQRMRAEQERKKAGAIL